MHRQIGFTLIESIIVISLVAILFVVAIGNESYSTGSVISVDAFSQQLCERLRYLQMQAMARNEILTVHFDATSINVTDSYGQPLSLFSDVMKTPDNVVIATSGLADHALSFYAEGTPHSNQVPLTSPTNILLQKNGVTLKTLSVLPQTGKINEM